MSAGPPPPPLARLRLGYDDGVLRRCEVMVGGSAVAQLPVHHVEMAGSPSGLTTARVSLHMDWVDVDQQRSAPADDEQLDVEAQERLRADWSRERDF